MKNFKRILALVIALVMAVGTLASVSAYNVSANPRTGWTSKAVGELQAWGVLSEADADAAAAGKLISRDTFNLWVAKILSQKTDKFWDASTETRYEDVENASNKSELHPEAIAYTTANGIVQGYTSAAPYQFGPNDNLKLGQAAAVVVRLLSRMGNETALFSSTYMKEVDEYQKTFGASWEAAFMAEAVKLNVIDSTYRNNCTNYSEAAALTYGEAAYLLYQAAYGKTAVEFDKGDAGQSGTIAALFTPGTGTRYYYGYITDVTGISTWDTLASVKVKLLVDVVNGAQVWSDEIEITTGQANVSNYLTIDKTKQSRFDTLRAGGALNATAGTNTNGTANYVSSLDYMVGGLVKVGYKGSFDAASYADANVLSVAKTDTLIVDTTFMYKEGYASQQYKYNHQYALLNFSGNILNYTPVLSTLYSADNAITKSSATSGGKTTYTITLKGVNYTLVSAYTANATANELIVFDADGTTVLEPATAYSKFLTIAEGAMRVVFRDENGDGKYDYATVMSSTPFTFNTTLNSNPNAIPTVSKNTGSYNPYSGTFADDANGTNSTAGTVWYVDVDGKKNLVRDTTNATWTHYLSGGVWKTFDQAGVLGYSYIKDVDGTDLTAEQAYNKVQTANYTYSLLSTDADGTKHIQLVQTISAYDSYILYNQSIKYNVQSNGVPATGATPFQFGDKDNSGLTVVLTVPYAAPNGNVYPYYAQLPLSDVTGKGYTQITGAVKAVDTVNAPSIGIDAYKVTVTTTDGKDVTIYIPSAASLPTYAQNRTLMYTLNGVSNKINIDTTSWLQYLADGYADNGQQFFPATEQNKPTWLLQRYISVLVDSNNNVILMDGATKDNSKIENNGFVTNVEKTENTNVVKVTIASLGSDNIVNGMTTHDIVASLSSAYEYGTYEMINRLCYVGVLTDTDAVNGTNIATNTYYTASTDNILYVSVRNDGNNKYLFPADDITTWITTSYENPITDLVFNPTKTLEDTNNGLTAAPKAAIVPTVAVPKVTNYYDTFVAGGFSYKVVAYDAAGKVVTDASAYTATEQAKFTYAYVKNTDYVYSVTYSKVSRLVVDFMKSYTLQEVYDGNVPATKDTKVIYNGELKSYGEIFAVQKVDPDFYNQETGEFGPSETTRIFVNEDGKVYTVLDYKGLVYKVDANGNYVVETDAAVVVNGTRSENITDFTQLPANIKAEFVETALPGNLTVVAHDNTKPETYVGKYVPGWSKVTIITSNQTTAAAPDATVVTDEFNVSDSTQILVITPSATKVGSTSLVDYTYTLTTVGALKATGKTLAVLSYQKYQDSSLGYVTLITVFGGYATAGTVSVDPGTPTPDVKVDTTKSIVYLPVSSSTSNYVTSGDDIYYVTSTMQALDITTGEKVGQLYYYYSTWNYDPAKYVHITPSNTGSVVIEGGHFYLIDNETKAIIEDLGTTRGGSVNLLARADLDLGGYSNPRRPAIATIGWYVRSLACNTAARTVTDIENGNTRVWTIPADQKTSLAANKQAAAHVFLETPLFTPADYNNGINRNLAANTTLGSFGTMQITKVTADSIIATVNGAANVDVTNYNWKFVYFDYEGNEIKVAEKQNISKPVLAYGAQDGVLGRNLILDNYAFEDAKTYFSAWYQSMTNAWTTAWSERVEKLWREIPIYWYEICLYNYEQALLKGTLAEIEQWKTELDAAKASYDKVVENIMDAQNDIFWSSNVASSKLYQSTIVAKINGTTPYYPTFDYYYDAATQTYVVFVTTFR